MSRDCDNCQALAAEVRRLRVQARRDREEIDDCHERIRVLKRVVYRLARETEETP